MDIHKSMGTHLWIFIGAECPCMDIHNWISMWISTLVWIIEDTHPKIMDIHVDIRGFLEIHAWICCGFSDQGRNKCNLRSFETFRFKSECF